MTWPASRGTATTPTSSPGGSSTGASADPATSGSGTRPTGSAPRTSRRSTATCRRTGWPRRPPRSRSGGDATRRPRGSAPRTVTTGPAGVLTRPGARRARSARASHHDQRDVVLDAVVTESLGDDPAAGRFGVVAGHERSSYELQAFDVRVRVLVGCSSPLDQAVGVEREGSPRWERDLSLWRCCSGSRPSSRPAETSAISASGCPRWATNGAGWPALQIVTRSKGGSVTAYTTVAEMSLSK